MSHEQGTFTSHYCQIIARSRAKGRLNETVYVRETVEDFKSLERAEKHLFEYHSRTPTFKSKSKCTSRVAS